MAIKLISKIPEPSEHEMQCALFTILGIYEDRIPEWKAIYAIPNGAKLPYGKTSKGKRYSREAVWLLKEGMKPGTPDICCPFKSEYPTGNFYPALYLEMKTPNNTLTPSQRKRIPILEAAGNCVKICKSVEAAFEQIRHYTYFRYINYLPEQITIIKLLTQIRI